MRAAIIRDFAAQPDKAEIFFNRALQRAGKLADGELGRIGGEFRHFAKMAANVWKRKAVFPSNLDASGPLGHPAS